MTFREALMTYIHFFAILGILILGACYLLIGKQKQLPKYAVFIILGIALLLRLIAAAVSKGFGSDTACFAAWADRIFKMGPSGFYSPDVFTDYPPGYMYILWPIGALRSLGIEYYSVLHLILLKLPSIICDMVCGYLIYKEACRKSTPSVALALSTAYLFNPVIILNSSVWGQVDSVFTLCVVLMCLFMMKGKMYPAYIIFAIGILIKPQTLLFGPILLAGILDHVILHDFSWKNFFKNLFQGLSAIAGMVLLALPFGFENVWKQYFSTVSSYPYAAVNAFNFWGLFGLNWISQDNTFLGIPYHTYGTLVIVAIVVIVLILSIRLKDNYEKYPFLGALLVLTIFVFSVRMHERYMYPGLVLLLLAFIYKPSKLTYLCYGGFSIMHFYNTAWVLFHYDPGNYDRKAPIFIAVSIGMLLCAGFLYYVTYRLYGGPKAPMLTWQNSGFGGYADTSRSRKSGNNSSYHRGSSFSAMVQHIFGKPDDTPRPSEKTVGLTKIDFILMAVITLVYGCIALYDLGNMDAPETHYDMEYEDTLVFDFGEKIPATLAYYTAPWQDRDFNVAGRNHSDESWIPADGILLDNVFTWQKVNINTNATQLQLTLQETQASIIEFVFLDATGEIITPLNASDYPLLFDETKLYPEVFSFRTGMYFDEIYHGRTAYEFINGLTSYENTHPPLGKAFIALGVLIFGMCPFGWRIAGALFGIAMVPVTYLFGKRLTKETPLAALTCILFTFDFMHFTQTRLATIDVYVTFFVILMYYFMFRYCSYSFYDTDLKKTFLPLGACGICMGLGVASKWTGIYAGAGLAIIFFANLYRRYREYLYAKKVPSGTTKGISHRHIINSFAPHTKKTIGFCIVFFVLIPGLIYLLSYIPFRDYSDRGLWSRMIYNQTTMLSYHSNLESSHPYASSWYQWPTIYKPIWYYSRIVTGVSQQGGLREGISAFGNPAVWWIGIPATLYMVYLWAKKKDKTACFLVIGYLAQYVPWFFVTRDTFIYHYFPSVIFVVLMIIHALVQLKQKMPVKAFYSTVAIYGLLVIGLFALFYPVLSGQPVDAAFVDKFLRWLDSWVLVSR